jgi:hypothetical protein
VLQLSGVAVCTKHPNPSAINVSIASTMNDSQAQQSGVIRLHSLKIASVHVQQQANRSLPARHFCIRTQTPASQLDQPIQWPPDAINECYQSLLKPAYFP